MAQAAAGKVPGGVHGFAPSLTSFVGRAGAVAEVAGLLGQFHLVTVTGPGGVGKTRLAGEVARRVAGEFADGVWLVELAAVQEPALVPAAVAAVLEVRERPGEPMVESLAAVVAGQQLLLVLDNCEHVLDAAAALCGALLGAADDVRVLATSREPVGVAGEARYRLPPLTLPGDGAAGAGGSEAVALFAERARQMDPHFPASAEAGPVVAALVARLDGMPLAIELAAARVESLGLSQLMERLDDRVALLAGGDRMAPPRLRSLAGAVDWSYRLLGGDEQRVFRQVSVFPGPFTLAAAEMVAGPGSGPVVLHLVDCSLLTPPRTGPDGRDRYLMLETLRAFGLDLLDGAGEQPAAAAALAQYALQVAEQTDAGMRTSTGEAAAARWLDAEDATMHQALAWCMEHDPAAALRLAIALAPWWTLRGRAVAGYALLRAAAGHAVAGEDAWCEAQLLLGKLSSTISDFAGALGHFTAAREGVTARGPSRALVWALFGSSTALTLLNRIPEAASDARRAWAVAEETGDPVAEAMACYSLGWIACCADDSATALTWLRRACQVDPAVIPGWLARLCRWVLTETLIDAGEDTAAQRSGAEGLAQARELGDLYHQANLLWTMAILDQQAGRLADARTHLHEAVWLAVRTGNQGRLVDCLDICGQLCAATGRWADAITVWAAYAACYRRTTLPIFSQETRRREEPMRKARQALAPDRTRAAEERGGAMTLATAAEYAAMLTAADPRRPQAPPGLGQLSARERELVALVAQGRTNAQIAAHLYISVRTVGSHLDRIRDKTGCRRRADLTRFALQAGLV
ncbi:MAG: LuxR C-terminal-related transcriptional regulator [Streptosporangiaceae bacterium]